MAAKKYNAMANTEFAELPWVTLDHSRLDILQTYHDSIPIAARCKNYVLQHMTGSPIEVEKDGETVEFTPDYDDFFQTEFTKFLHDAYDTYMTLGIIPITMVQEESGHFAPRVLKYGTYVIESAYVVESEKTYYRVKRAPMHVLRRRQDNGSVQSSMEQLSNLFVGQALGGLAQNANSGAASGIGRAFVENAQPNYDDWIPDLTVRVISGLGHDPALNGRIRSPLSSIYDQAILTNTLIWYKVRAERMMADPMLIMQHHKDDRKKDLSQYSDSMNGTFYHNNSFAAKEKAKVDMTQAQLEAAGMFWEEVNANRNETLLLQDKADKARLLGEVVKTRDYVIVPEGLEYVKNDNNVTQAGRDAFTQRKALDDDTSGLYGVPLNIFRNEGALRGNIQAQTALFHMMLMSHADMFSGIMTGLFDDIYRRADETTRGAMFGRKGVINDVDFVSYGVRKAKAEGQYIIDDETSSIAPAPPIESVMANSKSDTPADEEREEHVSDVVIDREKVADEAIKRVLEENKRLKDLLKSQSSQKGKNQKKARKGEKKTRERLTITGKTNRHKRFQYSVKIPVSHVTAEKTLKHLFDIGAITPKKYRDLSLIRHGFKPTSNDDDLNEAERRAMETLRDPGGSDANLDAAGDNSMPRAPVPSETIPVPLLLELLRENGHGDKVRKKRRQMGGKGAPKGEEMEKDPYTSSSSSSSSSSESESSSSSDSDTDKDNSDTENGEKKKTKKKKKTRRKRKRAADKKSTEDSQNKRARKSGSDGGKEDIKDGGASSGGDKGENKKEKGDKKSGK